MNGFDIALLVVGCVLVLVGLVKGMVRILVGMAALVAAFILAAQFHVPLADKLSVIDIPAAALSLIAYVLIFFGVMLAGGVVAYITRKALKVAMLSWADRLGGAALGAIAAMIAAALLVLPLVAYRPDSALLQRSTLAPYVAVMADLASPLVPDSMSDEYAQRMEELRQVWRERVVAGVAQEI
jgi:uncharacterized membrane protein required for colicin V production